MDEAEGESRLFRRAQGRSLHAEPPGRYGCLPSAHSTGPLEAHHETKVCGHLGECRDATRQKVWQLIFELNENVVYASASLVFYRPTKLKAEMMVLSLPIVQVLLSRDESSHVLEVA